MIIRKSFRVASLLAMGCLTAVLGLCPCLVQAGWSLFADYGYDVAAFDDYETPRSQEDQNGDILEPKNGVVSYSNGWTTQLSDQKASAIISLTGQVGSFHMYSSANAKSTRRQDYSLSNQVRAKSVSGVDMTFKDELLFKSKKPGKRLVTASWAIKNTSSLSSTALGVVSAGPDANGRYDDIVTSTGESWFNLTGTGVSAAPVFSLPNGTQYVGDPPWAYSWTTDGGARLPTIPHIEYDNPASIAVSFYATPGEALNVSWIMSVGASAQVSNLDLHAGTGTASGAAFYEHTINWGGITSVVDPDTGEADPDWSVTSASGLDYAHPFVETPEPSSIILASFGAFMASISSFGRRLPRNSAA